MGEVFRTRLFADSYTNAEKKYIRGSIAREAAGHGLVGAGVGYLGGKLAGKLATPKKEIFIEKYLQSNPKATKSEAEIAYKQRLAKFNKVGAITGGVLGAGVGAFAGNRIGKSSVGANRDFNNTLKNLKEHAIREREAAEKAFKNILP